MPRAPKATTSTVVARAQPHESKDSDTSSSGGFYRDRGQSLYVIRFAVAGKPEQSMGSINRRLRGKSLSGKRSDRPLG